MAWEMLMHVEKLPSDSVNWVPYNSVRDGVMAVLGGHGLATVAYVGLVKDQVTAGNLRVIGVMADKRLEQLPEVQNTEGAGHRRSDRAGSNGAASLDRRVCRPMSRTSSLAQSRRS